MDKRIKLGCIGAGSRGQYLLEAARLHPAAEITAVCDTDPEALSACREKFALPASKCFTSADELLSSGIDAVIIATHIAKHAEMAVKALEAGVHVLSEIPTIGSIDDAHTLLRATDAHPETINMAGAH